MVASTADVFRDMNQSLIQRGIAGVMPQALATGLFVSLCTIQSPDGTINPDGTPGEGFVDVAGLVNIKCMDAVPSDARIQATEKKTLQEILSAQYRHVLLGGYFPSILAGVGQGWRAVVDGIDYDLLGAEPDSQGQMIRLQLQLATV